ncbi:hypothetical protein H0H92_014495 [Tricholoma furcatifolium]|nr:hypothetical protein H0H92_014495 [Tricholoma furcatifolium]
MSPFLHHQHDVVDDSEPEREELRRQDKYERRCGARNVISHGTLHASTTLIEITDDEATGNQRPASNIILRKGTVEDSTSVATASPVTNVVNALDRGTISDDTQSNTDDEEPRMSLARFAYSGVPSAVRASSSKPSLSRQTSIVSSIAESQPPIKKPSHRFAAFFSDPEIGRVTRCVCCDVRWTARKSSAQKMVHIQSCAKKKSLTDETVRVLLRKEIDAYESSAECKGKGKENATGPSNPQTFLEEVVAEAAPRKKGRRVAVGQTVKTISETRNSILERARTIIESSSPTYVDPERIHDLQDSDSGHAPPSTQTFGTSALAQACKTTTRLFDYDKEHDDCAVLSSTQTFAPSRLGALQQTGQIHSYPNYTHALSSNSLNEGEATTAGRSNLRTSYERDESLIALYSSHDCERDNSEACLNELSFNKLPTSKANTMSPKRKSKTSKTTLFSSPKSKTRKPPGKSVNTPVKAKVVEASESLEARLKDQILQDTNLHLRILRYEPIHFDVFLKLVGNESASEKFRILLRSILDKEAIHFYGAERTKRH